MPHLSRRDLLRAASLAPALPFLAGRTLTLIHDGPQQNAATRQVTVGPDGRLALSLEVGGGAVLFQ